MIITILKLIIFITYIITILVKFKSLNSISESYYRWEENKKAFFTLFCYSLGFLLMFQNTGFFIASGAGLLLTGVASNFLSDDKLINIAHYVGASICIISAIIGLAIHYNLITYTILGITAILINWIVSRKRPNLILQIEITAFLVIAGGLVIKDFLI